MKSLLFLLSLMFFGQAAFSIQPTNSDAIKNFALTLNTLDDVVARGPTILAEAKTAHGLKQNVVLKTQDLWQKTAYLQFATILTAAQGTPSPLVNQKWSEFLRSNQWDHNKISPWNKGLNRIFNRLERNTPVAKWAPFLERYYSYLPAEVYKTYDVIGQSRKCTFYFKWAQYDLTKKCYTAVAANFKDNKTEWEKTDLFFERLFFWLSSGDTKDIREWMQKEPAGPMRSLAEMVLDRLENRPDDAMKIYNQYKLRFNDPDVKPFRRRFDDEKVKIDIDKGMSDEDLKIIMRHLQRDFRSNNQDSEADTNLLAKAYILKNDWASAEKQLKLADLKTWSNLNVKLTHQFYLCSLAWLQKESAAKNFCAEGEKISNDIKVFNNTFWRIQYMLNIMKVLESPTLSVESRKYLTVLKTQVAKSEVGRGILNPILDAILKTP